MASIEDTLRRGERDAKRIVIDCIESPKHEDQYAVKVTTRKGKTHEHYFENEETTIKFIKEVL